MVNIYITKQNTKLAKKGKRIIVKEEGEVISDLPLINIEQIVVLGRVSITGAMIQLLLKQGIPITYLSYYGKYKGRLVPEYSKNSIFRLKQFRAYEDDNFCINISRKFIKAKLNNMRVLLMRWSAKNRNDKIKKACNSIKQYINKVELRDNIDTIRGYEGIAGKNYFSSFALLLSDEFEFKGRNRRPPKDPVNSLLSFAYTLLFNNIVTALYLAGFDPYFGFFHTLQYGRISLALDLMEEFRQIIVDSMVKKVVNKGILTKDNFQIENDKVLLKDKGRKIFLKQYENRLDKKISLDLFESEFSWREIIQKQAEALRKAIENNSEYQAVEVR